MQHIILTLFLAGTALSLVAQPKLQADILNTTDTRKQVTFKSNGAALQPQLRPLSAANNGKTPFIKHFWEFDDGTYSTQDVDVHAFTANGSRPVYLTMLRDSRLLYS